MRLKPQNWVVVVLSLALLLYGWSLIFCFDISVYKIVHTNIKYTYIVLTRVQILANTKNFTVWFKYIHEFLIPKYMELNVAGFNHGWRKKGIRHGGGGANLRCPVFTSVHFSLHNESSSEYIHLCEGRESLSPNFKLLRSPGINSTELIPCK